MAQAGFVLPTTVLLVLMVVLTATALTYRTVNRSQMNIAQREQVRVANVAAPAIDRAKSKIEFIFTNDTRLTSGLPTPEVLASLMLATPYDDTVDPLVPGKDPFTLPGETRLDINNDGKLDNAWSFVDGNTGETVAYSILVEDKGLTAPTITVTSPINIAKARALVTRTGPVAATTPSPVCSNARAEAGWQVVDSGSSSTLQKNFQINVFVPNARDTNRTLEAFEFQQSRIAERGNKWAAWFRYDLDISPGGAFTMNGAMHTDSNLLVSGPETNSKFEAFKISSEKSCVYGKEASEITVGVGTSTNTFEGQIVRGSVVTNAYDTTAATKAIFHIWAGDDKAPTVANLTTQNDSVNGGTPGDIAVNPIKLFTEDKLEPLGSGWSRDNAAWEANPIRNGGTNGAPRVFNRRMPKPFVDDLFRADNRWGPKPRYSETIANLDITNTANKVGDPIASSLELLNNEQLGLDGFWERQAIANGLRLIVGQRLDLGNPRQWNFEPSRPKIDPETSLNTDTNAVDPTPPRDRLYPPAGTPPTRTGIGANEYRQKRSLQDNLSAVQGMVVYHYKLDSGKFPAACMAFTAHPGTPTTIARSRTFAQWINGKTKADFFNGQGTNGWEFKFPNDATNGFDTPDKFAAQIAADKPLGIALRNLAYFAGDPLGGAPSFPAVQDDPNTSTNVHPFPHQAMWGDFALLRRVMDTYDGMTSTLTATEKYDALSAADQATLHSSACTLSLLAYNLQEELNEYDQLFGLSSFDNLTSISGRVNTLVGEIANHIRTGNDPGNNFDAGTGSSKVSLVERLTSYNLNRTQWMQNRIYNILRTHLAKRDSTGEIVLDSNGKLILVNPADNTEITDGTPLKDTSGNILFDAEGVIRGVAATYDGPAATLTQLATWADQYLRNTFLNGQTLRRSDAMIAAGIIPARTLGGFVANDGTHLGGASEYFNDISFTQWKALFPHGTGNIAASDVQKFEDYALRVNRIYSLVRDRDLGFRVGRPQKNFTPVNSNITLPWDAQTGYLVPVEYGVGTENVTKYTFNLKTNCDPNVFRPILPAGGGGNNNVGISGLVGCSMQEELPVRNPSLYYLFPLQNHSHFGTGYHAQPQGDAGDRQPAEEYITRTYISAQNSGATRYKPVKLATETTDNDIIRATRHIAAVPSSRTDFTTWATPASAVTADTLLPTAASVNAANRAFSINLCGQQQACFDAAGVPITANLTGATVSFLDKGIFDGREQLAVRVADLNMAVLTSTDVVSGEKWIPDTQCVPSATVDCNLSSEGIVYAFREDAVREDEIVRPKNSSATATNCLTITDILSANCRMNVTTPQDPPLTAKGISLKPVDYHADPDRRPHGFRLRNGADMSNGKTRDVGMTFVTDNSVYIMGDFNLHFGSVKYKDASGTEITEGTEKVMEEFRATVGDKAWTVANFYTDRTEQGPGGLNLNFAREGTDTWRPVEILADAFTIISGSFIDGAAEDTFTKVYQTSGPLAANTSYMNQSRPNAAQNVRREDGTSSSAASASPVWIDRNGSAWVGSTRIEAVTPLTWTVLTDTDDTRRKNLQLVSAPMRVNAVLIGGLVPSRTDQGYGGLPNFPRLSQNWGGSNSTTRQPLIISGSFLQLNFSTGSTGPFEHDAWEPGATPAALTSTATGEFLGYYGPAIRRWGYDPALLYYPPAAASRRFASVGNLRSEYFRDLPADDPYVQLLRCAEDGSGYKIFDATIQGGLCPA